MSSSPLHNQIHELRGALTLLVNHQDDAERFSEDIIKAKKTTQQLLSELNQHLDLGLDICQFPDENPGLTE